MSIFLQNLALAVMGPQTRAFPVPFEVKHFNIGPLRINSFDVLILLTCVGLMIGLHFLVQKTKIGKAMRATALDKDTASLMGINVNRIIAFTFAVGSALAAAAGVLVGMNFNAVASGHGYDARAQGLCRGCPGRYRKHSRGNGRRRSPWYG